MKRGLTLTVSFAVIALYIYSLFLPPFKCVDISNTYRYGYQVLLGGWLGLIVLDPRWFLNILFFLVLFWNIYPSKEYKSQKTSFSVILIIGSLITLFIPAMGCSAGAATPGYSIGLAAGGYYWVFATVIGGFSTFIEELPLTHHSSGTG